MANSVCEVLLTERPLAVSKQDVNPFDSRSGQVLDAGAIVEFWGVVRRLEDGREIEGIDYQAHMAMAEHQLRLIAEEASKKFRLHRVVIHHRVGFVSAGEASLFLQVGAARRAAAFEASKWIVDELKKRVPIWKRPGFKIDNAVAGVVDAGPGSAIPARTR
jgi:molybdopterin synthase catalytic subunit